VLASMLLMAAPVAAVPVSIFESLATYDRRAEQIVIARCTSIRKSGDGYPGGVYPLEVDVRRVLKGSIKPGRTRTATIHPMRVGQEYLLANTGGMVYGTSFISLGELTVVPLPAGFRLESLDGKPLHEQLLAVFRARKTEVERALREPQDEQRRNALTEELRLLERATTPPEARGAAESRAREGRED